MRQEMCSLFNQINKQICPGVWYIVNKDTLNLFRDIRAKLKVIVDETREQYPEFNPCLAIVQV